MYRLMNVFFGVDILRTMGFITIFHHQLGNMFFQSIEQVNLSIEVLHQPGLRGGVAFFAVKKVMKYNSITLTKSHSKQL